MTISRPYVLPRAVVTQARDAISRAVRQAIQALIPTLLVIAAGGTRGLHVKAVLGLAGLAALVSLLKTAANLTLPGEAPLWEQVAERAVTAAAGTAIGLLTVDGFIPRDAINWQQTLTAVIGSALLAAAMFYTNPPVVAGEPVGTAVGTGDRADDAPVPAEPSTYAPSLDVDADLSRRRRDGL